MNNRRIIACGIAAALVTPLLSAAAEPLDPVPTDVVDCLGYAWGEDVSAAEFRQRDLENLYCSQQRYGDRAANPSGRAAGGYGYDPYREPSRQDGTRFRFSTPSIPSVPYAELYMPCPTDPEVCPDLPAGLGRFDPPYPAVVTIHGIISQAAFQWWAAQSLAEAGYLVLNLDTSSSRSANGSPTTGQVQTALTWLEDNADVDVARIGLTGHSQGGGTSFNLGRTDARVSAVVDEDDYTGSTGAGTYKPTLLLFADYEGFPGYPRPRVSAPANPDNVRGDSGKYNAVAEATDAMKIVVRATTHVDWIGNGGIGANRYVENTSVYYMLAWFDRYLKGKLVLTGDESPEAEAQERAHRQAIADDAFARLTATDFDGSADRHNISSGQYDWEQAVASGDLQFGGNVPYAIAGTSVADRFAFYWTSACALTAAAYIDDEPASASSANMRASGGCAVDNA